MYLHLRIDLEESKEMNWLWHERATSRENKTVQRIEIQDEHGRKVGHKAQERVQVSALEVVQGMPVFYCIIWPAPIHEISEYLTTFSQVPAAWGHAMSINWCDMKQGICPIKEKQIHAVGVQRPQAGLASQLLLLLSSVLWLCSGHLHANCLHCSFSLCFSITFINFSDW